MVSAHAIPYICSFYYCSDCVKDMPLWLVCVVYAGIYVIRLWLEDMLRWGFSNIKCDRVFSIYYLGFKQDKVSFGTHQKTSNLYRLRCMGNRFWIYKSCG
jgi:hypothetical protein